MRAGRAALLVGAIGYSLGAAATTPFTKPADLLTGLAIVAMLVVVVVRWPLRTKMVRTPDRAGHPYRPWVVLFAVFTVWELFNYLVHGTRAEHPTFSSITDAMDRFYLLKAALFLGWLAGAWVISGRGSGTPRLTPGTEP
jgi:hypothetical protein